MKALALRAGFAAALLLSAPLFAQSNVNTNPTLAPAGRYRAIGDHAQIIFSVLHLGLSPYYGRISGVTGTLAFTPLDLARSNVSVEVDPSTASTTTSQLNRELCSASVFNCSRFRRIAFKSTAITKTGDNSGDIIGDLTIAGVTKPVTLHAKFHGGMQGPLGQNNYQLGFSAETVVKRSDFGLTKMIWASTIADDVQLLIEAEFEQDHP
jgi:polyisoprenoid-binding protein YceI